MKNAKVAVVWSSETLPFDRPHTTSYSTLIENILYRLSYSAFFIESGEF